jgi:hypothetical protein
VKAFADLGDLPEADRVKLVVEACRAGNICGVVVETQAKADRYAELFKAYGVRIIDTKPGPIKDSVMLRVGPKES